MKSNNKIIEKKCKSKVKSDIFGTNNHQRILNSFSTDFSSSPSSSSSPFNYYFCSTIELDLQSNINSTFDDIKDEDCDDNDGIDLL
jgi:hypothetical protein